MAADRARVEHKSSERLFFEKHLSNAIADILVEHTEHISLIFFLIKIRQIQKF